MAYVPGYKHDIFLSYARAESEWVEAFRAALTEALHYLIGRAPAIWQDLRNIRFAQDWPDEIEKGIRDAATFLAVCSPSYFNSSWCAREYDTFAPNGSLKDLKVGSFYRFLKIIKTPDPDQVHTRFFKDLQHIQFFDNSEAEYVRGSREFMFEVGRAAKAIFELLRQMRNSKQALYVATAVPELDKEWQHLRDQLLDYGYDVRPTVVLTRAIEGLVEEELDRSLLAIFLLDGAENEFVKRQMDAARERNRRMIIWVHPRVGKSRQSDLLATILGDAPDGSQVLGGNSIRDFMHDLVELLAAKSEVAAVSAKTGRSVYLMHDTNQQREVERADRLRDLIRQQRMNVLPDTHVALTREAHERFMQVCDGLLLYRGPMDAPDKWLFQNLSEVQFAEKMYQLHAPLKAKALLLANPAQVTGLPDLDVLSYSEPVTADLLQPFFDKMREPGQVHVAN